MKTLCRTALMSLLTIAVLLGASGPALAESVTPRVGAQTFVTTDAFVDVLTGPGTPRALRIDTRLYVPSGASASKPQPAILSTHGFGLDKTSKEVVANATFLARHGYVVLTYTSQGFGASGGCVANQSRTYDVKNAQQLITKVLDPRKDVLHDASGAVVGMVGGSYGGGIQADLAENDKRIHAIVPGRTWNSLFYSLNPNNRVVPGDPTGFSQELNTQGVFKQQWTNLFFASGNLNPVGGTPGTTPMVPSPKGDCLRDKLLSGDPTTVAGAPCVGFYFATCSTTAQITTTGDARPEDVALLADSAAYPQIDKLRIPVLLIQGQADTLFNPNDAVSTYLALRRNKVPVKMIWNSGGHGGYNSQPGECEVYDGKQGIGGTDFRGLDDCYLPLRTLAFLDQALRGKADPSPGFTFFRDWVPYSGTGANDEQYGAAAAFPIPGSITFTLSGTNALVTTGALAGSASFLNPPGGLPAAYTETSNFTGPQAAPQVPLPTQEIPGQNVSFTSAPFTQDLVSVGVPSARLRLSHLAPRDLVFFGKVYDVAPDGSATLIKRLIAPVRVPAAEVGKPIDIKLIGISHRFAKGHAVRLTLASTDATSYNAKLPDQITVATGPGSTFTLPGTLAAATRTTAPAVPRPASGPLPATGPQPLAALGALGLLVLAGAMHRRRRTG